RTMTNDPAPQRARLRRRWAPRHVRLRRQLGRRRRRPRRLWPVRLLHRTLGMVRGFASLASIALLAVSCAAPPESSLTRGAAERTASTSAAIQGGQPDPSHPFVVGVLARLVGGVSGLCTAPLLAPTLVVVARHCVAPPASITVDCKSATF